MYSNLLGFDVDDMRFFILANDEFADARDINLHEKDSPEYKQNAAASQKLTGAFRDAAARVKEEGGGELSLFMGSGLFKEGTGLEYAVMKTEIDTFLKIVEKLKQDGTVKNITEIKKEDSSAYRLSKAAFTPH